jgi:hypothetical protein
MSYDYLEAVFVSTAGVVRAAWELGQPAGISGVNRGTGAYGSSGTTRAALLIAGKKNGYALLGLGPITSTRDKDGTVNDPDNVITNDTAAVTFSLKAVNTTLIGTSGATDSFVWTSAATTGINSTKTHLGDTDYPMYSMPNNSAGGTYNAKFIFSGGVSSANYGDSLFYRSTKPAATASPNWITHRAPRIFYGGTYRDLNNRVDYSTKASFQTGYTGVADTAFDPEVLLTFTVQSGQPGGVFSFFLGIPVYALSKADSVNGGGLGQTWYIRSGFGSELYSLDDGIGTGGSILMGVGISDIDWLEIEWIWAAS